MIPAVIAHNIRRQVLHYLESTFEFRDKAAGLAFLRFLEDPESGLFKGPWIHLQRPFRPADPNAEPPFDFPVPFTPHLHQFKSWSRLAPLNASSPQSTIITTGTGSGKTECFLYPILNHCLKTAGSPGIKAIVLYPMNALASDQERRFAELIYRTTELSNANIRVGCFIGRYDPSDPAGSMHGGDRTMGEKNGITHHETLREQPPDILLTNYKMLDFLLLRPEDQQIWRFNSPGTLKYLVLDELHTYDGAQGSDVACLIRRLKERLGIARGALCAIGTSATLDHRMKIRTQVDDVSRDALESPEERLARFAGKLFEEDISAEAIIGEERLRVDQFVTERHQIDFPTTPDECVPLPEETLIGYIRRQITQWKAPANIPDITSADKEESWRIALGNWVRNSDLFSDLVQVFADAEEAGCDPLTFIDLIEGLCRRNFAFHSISKYEDRENVLGSFLALINASRIERSGKTSVLAPVQVQLWIRELRRVGRIVASEPMFCWLDESSDQMVLPAFHCSECGETGWAAILNPDDDIKLLSRNIHGFKIYADPRTIYSSFIGESGRRGRDLVVISTRHAGDICPRDAQGDLERLDWYFYPSSRIIRQGEDPLDDEGVAVNISRETKMEESGRVIGNQVCPYCGSSDGILIIGSQAATLSSVAIDELFGSMLNEDARLLAFTDSVQDASHRAGFFSARTYHFTLRTAIRRMLEDYGSEGLLLRGSGRKLLEWASQKKPGLPGSMAQAISALLPPDLKEYSEYQQFRLNAKSAQMTPPGSLVDKISERLEWEIASEFGLMETHGRTLERSGSACLAYDSNVIALTIDRLMERLERINQHLQSVSKDVWKIWLLGILHRYRIKGALHHAFLDALAKDKFWGKLPFGRLIDGRESYPPSGRYKPRLIVTHPVDGHEFILAPPKGRNLSWPLVWTRRALQVPENLVSDTELVDLLNAMLLCGTDSGLLTRFQTGGITSFYAISADAAILRQDGVNFECTQSGRLLVRPPDEAIVWNGAPSLEYSAMHGRYRRTEFSPRQIYYQSRYRRGALRRVVSMEHTGLLTSEERETLETQFKESKNRWADDPNVITCTSTLEMGIDIGELSSAMLCSIPPQTANYLQRIGRAGRRSGAALIVAVVNQKPHDLFFHARPREMLRGRIDPPGCWLDASAVLIRQYFAFCFDCASSSSMLMQLPRTARQMRDDFQNQNGLIPNFLSWVKANETQLVDRFLARFESEITAETRSRFTEGTRTDHLLKRVGIALESFQQMILEIESARKRLREQEKHLETSEVAAAEEIELELKVLSGRLLRLNRVTSLELMTDHGLLPNYAFPERGVQFYGSVLNRHAKDRTESRKVFEAVRPAGTAIRELAPWNTFYTHGRQFDIQQLSLGSSQDSLLNSFAICSRCGFMNPPENSDTTRLTCPQCGNSGAGSPSDPGQQKKFLHFPSSSAISYMDQYESLSVDRSDEREKGFYHLLQSYDLTSDDISGVMGEDELPFGIEYRSTLTLRNVNAGFHNQTADFAFGPNVNAPELGFRLCKDCGVAVPPGGDPGKTPHRKSCPARRKAERLKQENRAGDAFSWEQLYLYRELTSEAIRILLPDTETEDIQTLQACFYLGLRLRFEGQPQHLMVTDQRMPDLNTGITRQYLVLMDIVPGGTGFLKTLYQQKDSSDREGEGIVEVMRRAFNSLETCDCGKLKPESEAADSDGCYRCIRSYGMQHKSSKISRRRGIDLLRKLIEAAERRKSVSRFDEISPVQIIESALEKRFVRALELFIRNSAGTWEDALVSGKTGFRFTISNRSEVWTLERQPTLGLPQSIAIPCQPDFLLKCDADHVLPIAVFTDGYEFHVNPNNRLADDVAKRRALIKSHRYRVWNITWDDIHEDASNSHLFEPGVLSVLEAMSKNHDPNSKGRPSTQAAALNGFRQLCAYLLCPSDSSWKMVAYFPIYQMLIQQLSSGILYDQDFRDRLDQWREGNTVEFTTPKTGGDWVAKLVLPETEDLLAACRVQELMKSGITAFDDIRSCARLDDRSEAIQAIGYKKRWRIFLAAINLFQFMSGFHLETISENAAIQVADLIHEGNERLSGDWLKLHQCAIKEIRPLISRLRRMDVVIPDYEYYLEENEEEFAELAWPGLKTAILAGGQIDAASKWQKSGWKILTAKEAGLRSDEEWKELIR